MVDRHQTHSNANVCNTAVSNLKSLDILSHLHDGTNCFMSWDELG